MEATALRAAALRTTVEQASGTESSLDSDAACLQALLGVSARDWAPCGIPPFAKVRLNAGRTLFYEGARMNAVYLVSAGQAKALRTEDDGYEQVCDFMGCGDLLGIESLAAGVYGHSAVALTPMTLWAIPSLAIPDLCSRLPGFDHQIKLHLCRAISRLTSLVWQMSATTAERRLARFIVLTSKDAQCRGVTSVRIHFEMNRRDIASYLGLAHESVSRALSNLSARQLISVDRRNVNVLDMDAIVSFSRSTRGAEALPTEEMTADAKRALVSLVPVGQRHNRGRACSLACA